ncbi:MAG: hypothetical protein ACTSPV_12415 [Candidatus Hodarchaeales archaeon]
MTQKKNFKFLDDKFKDQEFFFKILKPAVINGETVYQNFRYLQKIFNYKVNTWYEEPETELSSTMYGSGFYSYVDLESLLFSTTYYQRIAYGDLTIHRVKVKEIVAYRTDVIRSRKVLIEPPMSLEDIFFYCTGERDKKPERILEEFNYHKQQINKLSIVKNLLESFNELKENKKLLSKYRPLIDKYWSRYNELEPFFSHSQISCVVFNNLNLPHRFPGQFSISFSDFKSEEQIKKAIDDLEYAFYFVVNRLTKEPKSMETFIRKLAYKFHEILRETADNKKEVESLLAENKALIDTVKDFDDRSDNKYLTRAVKDYQRHDKKFRFSFLYSLKENSSESVVVNDKD